MILSESLAQQVLESLERLVVVERELRALRSAPPDDPPAPPDGSPDVPFEVPEWLRKEGDRLEAQYHRKQFRVVPKQ